MLYGAHIIWAIYFEPLVRKKKRSKLKKIIIEQNSTIQYEIQSMLEKFSPYNGRNNLDSSKKPRHEFKNTSCDLNCLRDLP